MEIFSLLTKRLKDDDVIDLLEWMDAEVVYDFDRLHENLPDVYWAKATTYGITLRFDENQRLDTAFLYVKPGEGHRAIDKALISDVTFFDSESEVREYAVSRGLQMATGLPPAAFPPPESWIRFDDEHHRVHYEFREGVLSLVTISSINEPIAS